MLQLKDKKYQYEFKRHNKIKFRFVPFTKYISKPKDIKELKLKKKE
jgi:hypothetical protein